MTRLIVVHVYVELPDDSTVHHDAVADEVRGALEVGIDPDNTPTLATVDSYSVEGEEAP